MLERRRSYLKRAFFSGALLAPFGILPIWLIEIVHVSLSVDAEFNTGLTHLLFLGVSFGLLVGCAAVCGAVIAPGLLGLSLLADRLAQQRMQTAQWLSRLYALVSAPLIALFSASIFSGRRAHALPGRELWVIGTGILAIAIVYGSARLALSVRDKIRSGRWGNRIVGLSIVLLFGAAWSAYLIDRYIFVGLYACAHIMLALAAIICAQLATGLFIGVIRPQSRRLGRLFDPGVAVFAILVFVTFGCWGLYGVHRSETLRFFLYRHTTIQSKVLDLFSRIGMMRGTTARSTAFSALENRDTESAQTPTGFRFAGGKTVAIGSNILLVTVDALRADHMGIYGYDRGTTPNIDRWARGAMRFERGYCPVPHTSFSLTSLMCGSHIGSRTSGTRPTLAALVRHYGYKTAAFFPPAVFFIDGTSLQSFSERKFDFEYVKFEFLPARKRVDQIITFLEKEFSQQKKKNFLIWAHFFEPHEPYEEHRSFGFGSRAVDRYDGEIAYVDHEIGRLISHVKSGYPQTIIGLSADHGEAFGEHGTHYHGGTLYDEQARVPLLIEVPGLRGGVVPGAAQTIDLPVTFLALLDIPVPVSMTGHDLRPWIEGASQRRLPPVFSELRNSRAIVWKGHKLIYHADHGFRELYDLGKDPHERSNIAAKYTNKVNELGGMLEEWYQGRNRSDSFAGEKNNDSARVLERGRRHDARVLPALLSLARRGDLAERREAVHLLLLFRDATVAKSFEGWLEESDPDIRLTATIGAALNGHQRSLEKLKTVLQRMDLPPDLRRVALLARARHGDVSVALELSEMIETSFSVYEKLETIRVLGALKDERSVPALRKAMVPLRTRRHAIDALGSIGTKSAIPWLTRALADDRYISWRQHAARALGRISSRLARPALIRAFRLEGEGSVVAEAAYALVRIDRAVRFDRLGIRTLSLGKWRCPSSAGGCEYDLGHECRGDEELLLIVNGRSSSAISVSCGSDEVGTIDPIPDGFNKPNAELPTPAMMVRLKPTGNRRLVVRSASSDAKIFYAGVRPILRRQYGGGPPHRTKGKSVRVRGGEPAHHGARQ